MEISILEKPKIWIFTGAGISAPSGIPTFRDSNNGLWNNYDINVVCNYHTWKKNRIKVFEFYKTLQEKYTSAEPNGAHKFIANLQKEYGKDRVKIITQNVDNLFEKAGCEDVVHLHGKVGYLQCTACGNVWVSKIDRNIRCPGIFGKSRKCNSLNGVKPYVVMFNEKAPKYNELVKMQKELKKSDVFIIIGTNGKVVDLTNIALYWGKPNKETKYWETNYFLNVMDEDHLLKIPSRKENYGIESCITFLPKIKSKIDEIMNIS